MTKTEEHGYVTMKPELGACWQLEQETLFWRVYTNEPRDTVILYEANRYDLIDDKTYEPTGRIGVKWQQLLSMTRKRFDSLTALDALDADEGNKP